MMTRDEAGEIVRREGKDILSSEGMRQAQSFVQHGSTSVYEHCVHVACMSLMIAARMRCAVDARAMVRGALLHDYFLYDWHGPGHGLHGFTHAKTAWRNARRDFRLGRIEQDVIRKHMFPLNIAPPLCRESLIVCLADKACAVGEMRRARALKKKTV